MLIQIAKTLVSTSIRHRSDTFVSDRCLIHVGPKVFVNWVSVLGWQCRGSYLIEYADLINSSLCFKPAYQPIAPGRIKSNLQIMDWYRQTTRRYLGQSWSGSMSPYGVTKPQWVNKCALNQICPEVPSPVAIWWLKSPAPRLFAQPIVHVQIKENTKTPRHWPLWWESTDDRWIPSQRASNTENVSNWWRHHAPRRRLIWWRMNFPWFLRSLPELPILWYPIQLEIPCCIKHLCGITSEYTY